MLLMLSYCFGLSYRFGLSLPEINECSEFGKRRGIGLIAYLTTFILQDNIRIIHFLET